MFQITGFEDESASAPEGSEACYLSLMNQGPTVFSALSSVKWING